jgi:hypothetical protein
VDMPRPFQAREKGMVTRPAYPLRKNGTVPWPPTRLSEYIIFTFVRDIRGKDMKSDINIRNQTAAKLESRNGNVWTTAVMQKLGAGPENFPVHRR